MRWLRRTIWLAIFVGIMVGGWRFASSNHAPLAVDYLVGSTEVPAWKALLGAFGLGFAVAATGWLLFGVRAGLVQRRYRKAVGGLESELHQLRNLPLAPDAHAPDGGHAAVSSRIASEGAGGRSG
jgi:uncharacterized integral membrane protein